MSKKIDLIVIDVQNDFCDVVPVKQQVPIVKQQVHDVSNLNIWPAHCLIGSHNNLIHTEFWSKFYDN